MDHLQPTGTIRAESQQLALRRLAAEQGQFVATNEIGAAVHRLLRIKQVTDKTGLSRTKIYLLIQQGQFPAPIKCGKCALWPEAAVDQWIIQLVKNSGVVTA